MGRMAYIEKEKAKKEAEASEKKAAKKAAAGSSKSQPFLIDDDEMSTHHLSFLSSNPHSTAALGKDYKMPSVPVRREVRMDLSRLLEVLQEGHDQVPPMSSSKLCSRRCAHILTLPSAVSASS